MDDSHGGRLEDRTNAPISAFILQLSALESLRTVEPFVSAISTLDAQQRDKGRHWKRPSHAPEPNNLFMYEKFAKDFELDESASFLTRLQRPAIDYLLLRQIQNRDWALHHVAEGIDHAQKDEFGEAMKKYQAALELDPECVEALVARGAASANAKQYSKAIADFKAALIVDPRHANASKYLAKTQSVYDQIESEKESARRGEFLLSSEHDSKLATSMKSVHGTEFSSFVDQLLNEEPDASHKRHKKAKKKHKKKEKKRKRKKESHDLNSDSSSESS